MSALKLYESMSELSTQMVAAARACDWDHLSDLEHDVARMRDALIRTDTAAGILSSEERKRKISLIHRLLEDDAEIRRHTEPWMEAVKGYLGAASRSQRLDRSYGKVATL